jgi:DNA-directed RNA polymerase specialized sigma subunit
MNYDSDSLLESHIAPSFNTWKADPSPANTSALLKTVHPIMTAALRTYGGSNSPTMLSKAKLITIDAMGRYDPTKSKMKTHLMSHLQGLRRASAKEQQILSVPEQVGLDLNTMREAENELKDKLGRDPSSIELADHTGLSLKRLAYIRNAKPSYAVGGLQRTYGDSEDIYTPAIQSDLQDNNAWHEFVYHDLMPIDQLILEHTLGLHGRRVLSNQELAKKIKLSPGAVSQRKSKIQDKLDLKDELGIFS